MTALVAGKPRFLRHDAQATARLPVRTASLRRLLARWRTPIRCNHCSQALTRRRFEHFDPAPLIDAIDAHACLGWNHYILEFVGHWRPNVLEFVFVGREIVAVDDI